jgi:hypothetical protein
MAKKPAHTDIVKVIRKLAADPNKVRLTSKAQYDLMLSPLTKKGVCILICDWIDAGGEIEEKSTTEPAKYKGVPVYIMKLAFEGEKYYIRVAIVRIVESGEELLIISVHPTH